MRSVEPSSFPISYHGEYHYRSGATKQQLTGTALSQFIMRKTGFRWEDVTVDDLSVHDLNEESFRIFRREALRRSRMAGDDLNVSNGELLSKLHLTREGKLKRSAVLLFYNDPSYIQNGIYVQIGRFGEGADLQYQDVLNGSLITIADKVIDLIFLKYLKAKITYVHDRRVETYPYARDAVREAVYNAIAHNCYMFGTPVQIRIEDREMIISNRCVLPEGWTVDTLIQPHESIPYNPDIATVFYRAGYIEQWGRGIQKIDEACRELGTASPTYELVGNSLRVHLYALESALVDQYPSSQQSNGGLDGGLGGGLENKIIGVIQLNSRMTVQQIADYLGLSKRSVEREMKKLRQEGKISREGGNRYGFWMIHD